LLEQWAKDKADELYLINHVGHNNLKEAENMAEFSKGKADAIAAIAPFYFIPGNMEILLDYCASIANKAPDLPFYYYHLPILTGVQFSMTAFAEKAKERIPNFSGIKFTENNVVEYQKLNTSQPSLEIFFGLDEAFVSSLSMNARGWVGSTYNHLSPLYHAIKKEFEQGNIFEANRLQSLGVEFVESLASLGGFNGAGKSFMQFLGVDCGPSRFPHNTLKREQFREAQKKFEVMGLNKYFSRC
jgi:N-acetylneuraminate lyase